MKKRSRVRYTKRSWGKSGHSYNRRANGRIEKNGECFVVRQHTLIEKSTRNALPLVCLPHRLKILTRLYTHVMVQILESALR